MVIGRFIGALFLVCSILVLGHDFWISYGIQSWSSIALGQLLYEVSPSILADIRATVQHNLGGRAWAIIEALLNVWAWISLLVIGVGLRIAFRRRLDVIE
jgi:hypothetical protein